MQQNAWYHATLRPAGPGSDVKPGAKPAPPTTRLQRAQALRKRADWQPDMPPVPPCAAPLLAWLFDVGPAMPGAHGPVPVTAQELLAWQHGQCLRLTPWQERTLRHLSRVYVAQLATAAAPDAPAPWLSDTAGSARADIALDMRAQMRALAAD